MALTKTLVLNESDGTGNLIATVAVTSTVEVDVSVTVTSATVNQFIVNAQAVLTQLGVFYALCQTQNMTLYVNGTGGGTPAATINLVAGTPVLFYPNCGYTATALLAANVTSIYASGAGTTTGQLDLRILKSA